MAITLQTTTYKVIYVFSRDAHPGMLKIGKTTVDAYNVEELTDNCPKLNEAAIERFSDISTYGLTDLRLHHTEVGYFKDSNGIEKSFDDHAVHDVLLNSGFTKADMSTIAGKPFEWFYVTLDKAIEAIKAVKNEQEKIDGPKIIPPKYPEIKFRDEQKNAIESTIEHFREVKHKDDRKMLWNAKMRFGKTLCALELINRLDINKVLILTHRPTVRSGWFDDYHLIRFKHEWQYGSKNGRKHAILNDPKGHSDDYTKGKDLQTLIDEHDENGTRFIYFASMQDLRGKENGREWKKNNAPVYATDWDLIIFDEAHEGTQTDLGKSVIKDLTTGHNPLKLYLSGTPFNILSQFEENEIYTWDYVMEQQAKESWSQLHPNEPNPYEGLAKLNIMTYNLGDVFQNNPEYVRSDEDFFNFAEFFRTFEGDPKKDGIDMPENAQVGHFIHEKDVISFLDLLRKSDDKSQYPYSNDNFRSALCHTLWMLPGVSQAARLAQLIYAHPLHTEDGFEVVNVAGEGEALTNEENGSKIEKREKDALDKVKKALKTHQRTITLSCGKLTTGVSVPEWTGVFMLSGGYSTGAANYMQTIFRGQTPYKNGAIKANCYAFDFAPDRTLTVVDDYIKAQPQGRNTTKREHGDRVKTIEDFLRFCPVISMKGSQEVTFDAMTFVNKVNQAYSDHIISQGFKSRHLFKKFAQFTQADHDLLAQVQSLIGSGKVKTNANGQIELANAGMDGSQASTSTSKPTGNKGTKGGKQEPSSTPKTQNTKNKEKEQQKRSQSVLDAIFVRFPLLLFGAVDNSEEITIEGLLDIIDEESWKEFMPKNFTKAIFRQISHLINVENLIASASQIVKRTKDMDGLPIQERIIAVAKMINNFHFTDKETVLTPWRVVNLHMSTTLGGYDFFDETHNTLLPSPVLREQEGITSEIFCNPDARVLEINSKSGVYPLWVAHTFWALLRNDGMGKEEDWQLWKQVVENNLYIVCKTRMAEKITRRVLCGYKDYIKPNTVSFENLIEIMKDEKQKKSLVKKIQAPTTYGKEGKETLRFDAVVGNPPYQKTNEGNGNGSDPIYHLFIDFSQECSDKVSLIHPSRFLFNAGKTPKPWNDKMLNDKHLKVVKYWDKSFQIFENVDIKGGVCITYWDKNSSFGPIGFFTIHDELNTILYKVKNSTFVPFSTIVGPRELYALTEVLYEDNPEMKGRQSKGHKYSMGANIFDVFPELFLDNYVGDTSEYFKIYGRQNNQRCYKCVKNTYINRPYNLNFYKVIVTKANGSGALGEPLSSPVVVSSGVGYTDSYLGIGVFEQEVEAEACLKYIKTKFTRTLLGTLKVTQDNPSDTWANIPLQDFSNASDIDWSKSIPEIDQQLYQKYNLSDEEIQFIEKMVKPME